jgi:hypothetical protein
MRRPLRKKFLDMFKPRYLLVFTAFLISCSASFGQYQKVSATETSANVFPVAELREGMRGTAKTVFRGSEPEEFNVEILGVLPNWIGPKQDLIIGRLSGPLAERTFVFAGMSGSPVYINGRLVGAISYSFPFAKEPICGITPIEQMMSAVEKSPPAKMASLGPKTFSFAEIASLNWQPQFLTNGGASGPLASGFASNSSLAAIAGQTFKPIATPLTFSGISQKTLDRFADQFLAAGIIAVAASGGSSTSAALKPAAADTLLGGDSIAIQLSRGDVSITAAGTVTLRDGDKIFAFGHPFFGLGSTSLPMSESHVVTVVPNANNSFKLAVPDSMVGSMTQDRATTIYGSLGETARMLPVKIKLNTSRGRTEEINFESVVDPLLTPLIVNAGINNVLSANERGFGDTTIELSTEIAIKNEAPIKLQRRFTGPQAGIFTAGATVVPLAALLKADFPGMEITGITLNISAVDGSKNAVLERLSVDRDSVRPGETIQVTAYERTSAGEMVIQKIPVTIPVDTPAGSLTLMVADGGAVQQSLVVTQFAANTAADLIRTFNQLKRTDRLYAILTRTSNGAVIGTSEMPDLPPSMLATINNDRTSGGSKPAVQSTISSTELPAVEYLVTGQQKLTIDVVK